MQLKYNYLAVTCCYLCFISCVSSGIKSKTSGFLPAAALQPYGRYVINQEQQLELVSSAAHFGFSFECRECRIFAAIPDAGGHNYLQYELDGVYQKGIRIAGQAKDTVRITAPTAGKHTLWVYKATEAHTGPITILQITGKNVKAIPKSQAPLIEFIGNSITCRAAADPSEVPCGTGVYHDQHNAYAAYTPQVVSIALGTNDFSKGDGKKQWLPFDSAAFVSSYVTFVQLVKSKYPQARIALLSSPMMNDPGRRTLQNCLTAVKEKTDAAHPTDKPVTLHFFQPMQARGCTGHPNVEDHAVLAQELIPFFKKLVP